MVTDRGRSYEAHSFSRVKQQKCLAHLQKTLSVLLDRKKGRAAELRFVISYQLRERALRDRDNQHLLKVLREYHQRGELLRFLEEPLVEPTNNRVERALRLAVIARKVSQCSKNGAGACAFSAFKSVIQTLAKRGAGSVVEGLYALFRSPKGLLAPSLAPRFGR
jgi:hypothetical protein